MPGNEGEIRFSAEYFDHVSGGFGIIRSAIIMEESDVSLVDHS